MAFDPSRYLIAESTAAFPLLHVDPAELDDVILQHGIGAELRRSSICPCTRRETRGPRVDCPSCRGLGRFYPETHRESVVVLMTSRNPRKADEAAGVMFPGDAQATFPRGILPGRGDMLLPEGDYHVVDQLLYPPTLGAGSRTAARAAEAGLTDVVPVTSTTPELTLLYPGFNAAGEPDLCVDLVTYWNGERTVVATEGLEWSLVAGNQIRWLGSPTPEVIAVRYKAPSAFVVEYDPAKFRAEAGVGYPFRCTVHRLDKWAARDLL